MVRAHAMAAFALVVAGAAAAQAQSWEKWSAWHAADDPHVQYRTNLDGGLTGRIEFKTQDRGANGSTRIEYTLHCDDRAFDQHGVAYVENEGLSPPQLFQTCRNGPPDLVQVDVK